MGRYLPPTIGCVLVGGTIASLAKRHSEARSYFVYIGRNFGAVPGALAGWAMVLAYVTTAVAVLMSEPLFVNNVLGVFHVTLGFDAELFISLFVTTLVVMATYRDIQFFSRMGLILEAVSVGVIVIMGTTQLLQRAPYLVSRVGVCVSEQRLSSPHRSRGFPVAGRRGSPYRPCGLSPRFCRA